MSEKDAKKGKSAKDSKGGKDEQPKQAKQPKQPKQPKQDSADAKQQAEVREERPARPTAPARLQTFYRDTVMKDLTQQFGYKSVMQVPRIQKIVLNMGVGEAVADKKIMDNAVGDLTKITGQKPKVTRARKSVATFKVRDGLAIGCMVTLRGARMYEFLDRLVSIAMPRIRDFRGVSARSFDGRGNYNFGVKEQIIFPEIAYDQIDAIRGMDITITTTARDDKQGRALLEAFNFPFRK
jgi:large subunit ribosomal protein L5